MKHLVAVTAAFMTFSGAALASPITDAFSSFVVFGDSLSDNGNLFGTTGNPPSPYFNGRFSNGPVWNEAIGTEFSGGMTNPALGGSVEGAVNMAFGGARADTDPNSSGPIPSLLTQLGIFLGSGGVFQPSSLVSVWAGANDIFQDVDGGGVGTDVGNNTANDVAGALDTLVASAAKNLLVFNLPDFGVLPRYASNPLKGEAMDAIAAFNATLSTSLDTLESANPDVTIYRVDAFAIFNELIADATSFGISNVSEPCITTLACILGPKSVQDTFLFWDEVHPTQGGHRLIEAAARRALAPAAVPLPASAPLLLAGFALMGFAARRRQFS